MTRLFLKTLEEVNISIGVVYLNLMIKATRSRTVDLDDIKFHQCVRLTRFENERTISFIPPDGDFELMSYRLEMNVLDKTCDNLSIVF